MSHKTFLLMFLTLMGSIVYLFVEAPQALPDGKAGEDRTIPVNRLLDIVANENNAVRALYTQEIVGEGEKAGLQFSEDWQEASVEAGPLPALFLREASRSLEKNARPLSLFLGSDFPIASSNAFKGIQIEKFNRIKQTLRPEYFYADDIRRYTAMYPDYAVSAACVDCHNEHPNSPKKDWRLQDMMGATTWLYPDEMTTPGELIKTLVAAREAFKTAYQAYLDKVKSFGNPPLIGEKWPREGYYLPSAEVFMQEVDARVAGATLDGLMRANEPPMHSPENDGKPF